MGGFVHRGFESLPLRSNSVIAGFRFSVKAGAA
jgi:hypothetical protein